MDIQKRNKLENYREYCNFHTLLKCGIIADIALEIIIEARKVLCLGIIYTSSFYNKNRDHDNNLKEIKRYINSGVIILKNRKIQETNLKKLKEWFKENNINFKIYKNIKDKYLLNSLVQKSKEKYIFYYDLDEKFIGKLDICGEYEEYKILYKYKDYKPYYLYSQIFSKSVKFNRHSFSTNEIFGTNQKKLKNCSLLSRPYVEK